MAMRVLEHSEISQFLHDCEEAEKDIGKRDLILEEIYSKFETNLTLLGASAVEDRLQEAVPQTIRELQSANIKIWMLTGDKLETAENISFSCNLID